MSDEMRRAFLERLEDIGEKYADDAEMAHYCGDAILCEVLTELGYADIVEAWDALGKWYS